MMLNAGRRDVIWYPETAYWVNYDINVPLFLPLYAERRLYDLRMIAQEEERLQQRIQGQVIFSSGWEWTYWMNDLIAARAAYDPMLELRHEDAVIKYLNLVTQYFGTQGPRINYLLADLIKNEHELLILGRVKGRNPPKVEKYNGISYLQGKSNR